METRKIEIISFKLTTLQKKQIKDYLKEKGIKNISKFVMDCINSKINKETYKSLL